MTTSATVVKELRDRTGAGFMECKNALTETNNDIEKAIDFLRKRGLAKAAKKAGRAVNEGRVHAYLHGTGKLGVMIEINCETDFVANTDEFKDFVNDVAMHVAAANPRYLTKEEVPAGDVEKEREVLRAQAESSGKPAAVIEKMVEGRIGKFFEEHCLLHQKFVKEPEKTIENLLQENIAKLGENMSIGRFVRFQLGEDRNTSEE